MFQSPSDTSGEIIHVIRILTHFLAGSIGDLCHIHAVAGSGLHDNIQRFLAGIIGNIGSDTESHGHPVPECLTQFIRPCKVQAVTEQQLFKTDIG